MSHPDKYTDHLEALSLPKHFGQYSLAVGHQAMAVNAFSLIGLHNAIMRLVSTAIPTQRPPPPQNTHSTQQTYTKTIPVGHRHESPSP
jgi:hypothetical protein